MTTHAKITQFLDTVYSPDNPHTARDKLEQAVVLMRELKEQLDQAAVKPEDRL